MRYSDLTPEIREAAERVLTRKQLTTYKLSTNGLSERGIADHLGISRWAVRDRLAQADRKIYAELQRKDVA